jgi:hypothetical protein
VRLLFDEQLSEALVRELVAPFPGALTERRMYEAIELHIEGLVEC